MQRILIASDDDFLREMIRRALTGLDAEVRGTRCGREMERLCRRMLFDLVIVLGAGPFLCGRDPVRHSRPEGVRRPLFYVISWQQAEQTVLSLLECGVDQYLTFPVNLQRLRNKVANDLTKTE